MTHSHHGPEKQKLLNRIRRLRGQIDSIERALDADAGCTDIMRRSPQSTRRIAGSSSTTSTV